MKPITYTNAKIDSDNISQEITLETFIEEYFINNGIEEVQNRKIRTPLSKVPFDDKQSCEHVFKMIVNKVIAQALLTSPLEIIQF